MSMSIPSIVDEILGEYEKLHGLQFTRPAWAESIRATVSHRLTDVSNTGDSYRDTLVQLAARAIAAIEAYEREASDNYGTRHDPKTAS
jgi:hypothetical protein